MDYQTAQTMRMTFASYIKAIEKVEQFCPRMSLFGHNGGSPATFRLDLKDVWGSTQLDKVIVAATRIWVSARELFSIGDPIRPKPGSWIWDSDFLKTSVYVDVPFEEFGWKIGCSAMTDEDGSVIKESVPTKIVSKNATAVFNCDGYKWGLKDWRVRHDEIAGAYDKCSAEVSEA